jgi:hypothetical protein
MSSVEPKILANDIIISYVLYYSYVLFCIIYFCEMFDWRYLISVSPEVILSRSFILNT